MNIGLDFDGVIANCGALKSTYAKQLYGIDISPTQCKKELVITHNILSIEQYQVLQTIIYETEEVGLLMPPVPDALNHIAALLSAGHSLKIVTSRRHQGLTVAEHWLQQHTLNIPIVGCGLDANKAFACTGLDVFIDDDLEKLIPLQQTVPHRYLLSWGYNTHEQAEPVACRVASWSDFYSHIHTLGNSHK
jgi:5' nucleotidase, deoxy (Pyrimidine), cytosolic type C protein (NT5C)